MLPIVALGVVALAGYLLSGCQGERGERGERGSEGPPGPQGAIGPRGADGFRGPVGPTGPTGPQGPRGNDGFQGPPGRSVDYSTCIWRHTDFVGNDRGRTDYLRYVAATSIDCGPGRIIVNPGCHFFLLGAPVSSNEKISGPCNSIVNSYFQGLFSPRTSISGLCPSGISNEESALRTWMCLNSEAPSTRADFAIGVMAYGLCCVRP